MYCQRLTSSTLLLILLLYEEALSHGFDADWGRYYRDGDIVYWLEINSMSQKELIQMLIRPSAFRGDGIYSNN